MSKNKSGVARHDSAQQVNDRAAQNATAARNTVRRVLQSRIAHQEVCEAAEVPSIIPDQQ
jgi:hypothetical protein